MLPKAAAYCNTLFSGFYAKKKHGTHNNPKVKGASNPNKNCRQIAERLALRSRKAGSNGQVWAGSVIGAWGLHLILAKLKTSGMEGRRG